MRDDLWAGHRPLRLGTAGRGRPLAPSLCPHTRLHLHTNDFCLSVCSLRFSVWGTRHQRLGGERHWLGRQTWALIPPDRTETFVSGERKTRRNDRNEGALEGPGSWAVWCRRSAWGSTSWRLGLGLGLGAHCVQEGARGPHSQRRTSVRTDKGLSVPSSQHETGD